MAYTPTVWQTGDLIDKPKLDKIETGVQSAAATADSALSGLSGKSDTSHTHDSRYYTEGETDTLLNGKANATHNHTASQVTDLAEVVRDTMGVALVAGENVTITPDDAGDKITIAAAGGGGGGGNAGRNWMPNTWCLPSASLRATTSNEASTANTLYMVPFYVTSAGAVTDIAISVQTAAEAGNNARLGIYRQDESGSGWTLVNDAGTVAIDSTGTKTLSGLSIALNSAGLYGIAVLLQAACTLTAQGADPTFAGLQNPFSNSARVYVSVAQTYGALPTTALAAPGGGFSTVYHRAMVKLA